MINPGYTLKKEDIVQYKDLKNSVAYNNYLKSIASSPAYIAVMQEHIGNIDISPDINRLKNEGVIPKEVNEQLINELFVNTLNKMAINIVADTIIIRETEMVNIQNVIDDINEDSIITYVMGLADPKMYDKANKLLDEGKLKNEDIIFKGLMAFEKRNKDYKDKKIINNIATETTIEAEPKVIKKKSKTKKVSFNLDDDDIIID